MATQLTQKVGGPTGAIQTYIANGTILMMRLVKESTAGKVIETGTGTDAALGIALFDEARAFENSAESYATTEPLRVEFLTPGQIWPLTAEESLSYGDLLCPGADGKVKVLSGTGENVQFKALAAGDADAQVRCLVTAVGKNASPDATGG